MELKIKIIKAKETMTAKLRVQKTFNFEKTDRVPLDISTNPVICNKLMKTLGAANYDEMLDFLGVDIKGVYPNYTGKVLHKPIEGRNVHPFIGSVTRLIENGYGSYWDYCDFPLKGAEPEVIANFPLHNPDDFDYETALSYAKTIKDYGLYIGGAGTGDVINSTGFLMGMEDILVNLMLRDEATLTYLERKKNADLGVLERLLDKCKDYIDFLHLGEDLGTQIAPIISLELYRDVLKPIHQPFIDLAKSYNIPIMIHTCGSSSWVYEDFIKMGMNAVDTLQPEAKNMSPKYLTEHFGGRLAFHGCISTAGALAYGTVEDVIKDVKDTLDIMMPYKGYFCAPTHQIQDNSPVENVIAMYQTAHDFGVYK
jgi:uroporphyrinogen decarboxylase